MMWNVIISLAYIGQDVGHQIFAHSSPKFKLH